MINEPITNIIRDNFEQVARYIAGETVLHGVFIGDGLIKAKANTTEQRLLIIRSVKDLIHSVKHMVLTDGPVAACDALAKELVKEPDMKKRLEQYQKIQAQKLIEIKVAIYHYYIKNFDFDQE